MSPLPVGTVIRDTDTGEQLGDLAKVGDELLVARGGKGGWGNTRFKSSTNRAPRQFGPGLPGEKRQLELEMKVIADVGLLGMPNAGKSTLIRAVSHARPKVADYPFTTLYPNLGVVSAGENRSFVMADIPGLIEGAAEGHGLGIRFLKHLQRTRVLLHLVDIAPVDPAVDPVKEVRAIVGELKKFSADLVQKPRWLLLNKSDLLPPEEAAARAKDIVRRLRFKGPHFLISGATGAGTADLVQAVMTFLEQNQRAADDAGGRGRGLGHCADARGEPALVPVGLVAMNDLLVDQRVDDRDGLAVAGTGGFLVATFDGGSDLADGTAHARTKGNIACAVLLSLFGGFFRGLGIGQRTLRKN